MICFNNIKYLYYLRITPIIWFGGLYQESKIPDYEEDTLWVFSS